MTTMNLIESVEDSSLCRLCAGLNQSGICIFSEAEADLNLSLIINKYLPLKVENDGKFPDKICTSCHIQLNTTKLFFDSIIEGQNQLKMIYDRINEGATLQDISSKIGTFEVQSAESGEKYLIQIVNSDLIDAPFYSTDHAMVSLMNSLNKEKKKRGRPKRQPDNDKDDKILDANIDSRKEEVTCSSNTISISEDNGKRRRKLPARFIETVQGKELDDILREEGIEVEDDGSNIEIVEEREIIGRIESQDMRETGEPVLMRKSVSRNRIDRSEIQRRRRKKKFKCDQCPEEFRNLLRLKLHVEEIHENKTLDSVDNCKETENKLEEISEKMGEDQEEKKTISISAVNVEKSKKDELSHEEKANTQESLKCDKCNQVFKCEQNLKVHIEGVHEQKKPFKCTECKQSFPYAKTLRVHQLKHRKGAVYSCEACPKKFNHPSSLVYHRNAEHNNGKRFVCNKCNKTFKHLQILHRHQLVHSEERPFKCSLCTSSFKTRANLVSHNAVHTGVRNFACTICGHTFSHKTTLNLHMKWHSGEKPFSCDVCSRSFTQKGNLVEHKRIHTGEKPFCCDMCGQSFTTSSQLKLHSKRHTGEKPWKCDFCPKKFLHKDTWQHHIRRHLNEKPFHCTLCPKSFTVAQCLKKHMRFHTGEKPYSCDICLKGFTDTSNLTKHRRIHEKSSVQPQQSLLNTNADNNLFYVYYDAAKDQNNEVPMVDMKATETEVIIHSEPEQPYKESLQFQQLVDQEGNPLSLNTQDGHQINVVSSVTDGHEKLQGLLPDGTLVAIDLQDSKVESIERLADPVEDEASVSHLLLDGSMTFLDENINKSGSSILITEQPICYVTYDPTTGNIIE